MDYKTPIKNDCIRKCLQPNVFNSCTTFNWKSQLWVHFLNNGCTFSQKLTYAVLGIKSFNFLYFVYVSCISGWYRGWQLSLRGMLLKITLSITHNPLAWPTVPPQAAPPFPWPPTDPPHTSRELGSSISCWSYSNQHTNMVTTVHWEQSLALSTPCQLQFSSDLYLFLCL